MQDTNTRNRIFSLLAVLIAFFSSGDLRLANAQMEMDFEMDATIDVNNFDFEGYDVTVSSGATLTINGLHAFNSITVIEGSSITHDVEIGMDLVIAQDVLVELGSEITADGRGFGSDSGPGGGLAGTSGGGAGHGGAGADGNATGGGTYGSLTQPVALGSGGGTSTNSALAGRRGGGALRLAVSGALTVDGQVTADGMGGNVNAGSGSGGSVWIDASSLNGLGTISANGGVGGGGGSGGGSGGGGRIAICLGQSMSFEEDNIGCHGGNALFDGGAGTIYLRRSSTEPADLIVDNNGIVGEFTEMSGNLNIPGNVIVREGGRLGPRLGVTDFSLAVSGDMFIGVGASFDADGRGDDSDSGPGAGMAGSGGGGAGHGGAGADGNSTGGGTYGSITQPNTLGSGGGTSTNGATAGRRGGGVLRLIVGGTLTLNGQITADGMGGNINGGSGSGGSVWIEAGSLGGFGTISATGGVGGSGGAGGGSGGGGRIAIYIDQSSSFDDDNIQCHGGNALYDGGAGTIYFQRSSTAPADLIVDNNNVNGEFTEFTELVNVLGNLIVRGNAKVGPEPGDASLHINVTNDIFIAGSGLVSADQRGFTGGNGPGAGAGGINAAGGGHGGMGGSVPMGPIGGMPYGSEFQPLDLGSGGGNGPGTCMGGSGGGSIRLTAGGTLTINGFITADGGNGTTGGCNGGGGAGGSISLTACDLDGFGIISATGGSGPNAARGGSGGRIAIYTPDPDLPGFAGVIEVTGTDGGGNGSLILGEGCFEKDGFSSSQPALARIIEGALIDQINEVNSGPPSSGFTSVNRQLDNLFPSAFVCDAGAGAIVISNGSIQQLGNPPGDLNNGILTSDITIRIFAESTQIQPLPMIAVDATQPGTYDQNNLPPGGFLPPSLFMTSHLLHFDTSSDQTAVILQASVVFESEILGVIIDGNRLNQSDGVVGSASTAYPSNPQRAWEVDDDFGFFIISPDRTTLTVRGQVEEFLDQMRVLTASSPPNILAQPYVAAINNILAVEEVTLDNCSSAWYRFTFELPSGFKNASITGIANVDDVAVAYLNGSQISASVMMGDLGVDRVDSQGRALLSWPTQDAFATSFQNHFVTGINELMFGVIGDLSQFEPTGVEFNAVLQFDDPNAIILGDINGDGIVSLLDVQPFVAVLVSGGFQPEADINRDGVVNLQDIQPFVQLLTG